MERTGITRWKKIRQPTVLAILCGTFLITSVFAVNPLNNAAERSASTIIASTTATYIALRLINSALSTAQEAELEGNVAVIGGKIAPLKALEPIDDTVERVSIGIFLVAISSSLLSIAFNPLGGFGWALLLCYFGLRIWVDHGENSSFWQDIGAAGLESFVHFLIRTGLGLALVLPIAFISSVHLGNFLTQSAWHNSQMIFDDIVGTIEKISPTDKETGFAPTASAPSASGTGTSIPSISDAQSQSGVIPWIVNIYKEGIDVVEGVTEGVANVSGMVNTFTRVLYTEIQTYRKIAGVVLSRADELLFSMITILVVLVFKSFVLPLILGLFLMGVIKTSGILQGSIRIPHALFLRRSRPKDSS